MDVKNWLEHRTIYLARHGSHAYGTNVATSDEDFRGIAIPPKEYFLGFLARFEQVESKGDNTESVIFDIRKFIHLAADCNPNVLEILFVSPKDQLKVTKVAELLLEQRRKFLSKKAKHTFSGYAMSQLKRIETHRRWLLDPPQAPPKREDFGLPARSTLPKDQMDAAASLIRKKVESWDIDMDALDDAGKIQLREKFIEILTEMNLSKEEQQFKVAGKILHFSENFMEILNHERKYLAAQRNFEQYRTWLKTRNPARAELEAKYGYDCKHGMHLVRLMRMCKELLETEELNVYRPDAQELLEIRNGAWSYEKLMDWAYQQDEILTEVYEKSKLPHAPDRVALDQLCIQMIETMGFASE